jgi:hypothetical protein
MTWVKRGGGSGTGIYDQGLFVDGSPTAPQPPVRPTPQAPAKPRREPEAPNRSEAPVIAPAYRVTQWSQARDNKILLDLLAHGVATQGWAPESSVYYDDAVATFGETSVHFLAACRGEHGAGAHYQRTVAGGRFRNGEIL